MRVAVVQAILASVLFLAALAGRPSLQSALVSAIAAYAIVYMYGLIAVTTFAAALRAIAEHQLHGQSDIQGYAALRNFKCNAVTRFLMGAYGFGEHETHHLHPGIPYYRLPAATALLAAEQESLAPRQGYFTMLFHIWGDDPAALDERRAPTV
jgi:fatty acid desaturase